mmetsp:Transcript_15289/g.44202  ORF Transcript_15289/g.44202 Transcript_15289/m.44202 type:complete len:498 (+) Transcript_15289:180-1673(+)
MVSIRKTSVDGGGGQLQVLFRISWFVLIGITGCALLYLQHQFGAELGLKTPTHQRGPIGDGSGDNDAPLAQAYWKKSELLRTERAALQKAKVAVGLASAPTSTPPASISTKQGTDDVEASKVPPAATNDSNEAAGTTSSNVEGTYFGPRRTVGSKDATVMAMASGYGLSVYKNYVGSLRKSGFEGHIILGVSAPLDKEVEQYFAEQKVTPKILQFVNCTFEPLVRSSNKPGEDNSHEKEQNTCAHPYSDIKLRWSRFPLLRDFLKACEECTGPVLISDARDVFFQRDPFGVGAPEVTGLQVFEEHHTQTTAHWLVREVVRDCKGMDFGKPPLESTMLCSGTTIGTRDAMLQYLSTMYEEMQAWTKDKKCCCNKMNGDDQSIHNFLFYTGKLPFAKAIPNRMGIINTAGVQGSFAIESHSENWVKEGLTRPESMGKSYQGAKSHRWIGKEFDLTDSSGFFTDHNGERSRVVHQYDRFGIPMRDYLTKNKGPLYDHLDG